MDNEKLDEIVKIKKESLNKLRKYTEKRDSFSKMGFEEKIIKRVKMMMRLYLFFLFLVFIVAAVLGDKAIFLSIIGSYKLQCCSMILGVLLVKKNKSYPVSEDELVYLRMQNEIEVRKLERYNEAIDLSFMMTFMGDKVSSEKGMKYKEELSKLDNLAIQEVLSDEFKMFYGNDKKYRYFRNILAGLLISLFTFSLPVLVSGSEFSLLEFLLPLIITSASVVGYSMYKDKVYDSAYRKLDERYEFDKMDDSGLMEVQLVKVAELIMSNDEIREITQNKEYTIEPLKGERCVNEKIKKKIKNYKK